MTDWIEKTHRIIKTALSKAKRPAVLCSYGKDSIVLLDLLRQHINLDRLRVIHVDTTFEFPQLYAYKKYIIKEFAIGSGDLTVTNTAALNSGMNYENTPVFEVTAALKTEPLKQVIRDEAIDFLFTGIRRDEEGSRAKERYFSYRDAQGVYEPSDNNPEFHPFEGINISTPEKGITASIPCWTGRNWTSGNTPWNASFPCVPFTLQLTANATVPLGVCL